MKERYALRDTRSFLAEINLENLEDFNLFEENTATHFNEKSAMKRKMLKIQKEKYCMVKKIPYG